MPLFFRLKTDTHLDGFTHATDYRPEEVPEDLRDRFAERRIPSDLVVQDLPPGPEPPPAPAKKKAAKKR